MTRHDCDLCGGAYSKPIAAAQPYIGAQEPPHVCGACGFVYVKDRRSSEEIAKDWDNIWGEGYSSKWPMVQARLFYVAEWCSQELASQPMASWLDIGAGEGDFANMVIRRGGDVTGIEPYGENVEKLSRLGAKAFSGTIREYALTVDQQHDVATILWTLENCGDCVEMLKLAKQCTKPGGHVVVATGSRILVPYKKPLSHYFSTNAQDLHSFRFSRNTLAMAMTKAGLTPMKENRWLDGDWLVMAGQNNEEQPAITGHGDDPDEVMAFFESWAREWQ